MVVTLGQLPIPAVAFSPDPSPQSISAPLFGTTIPLEDQVHVTYPGAV